jgi:SEC-C motif-containing protein
MRSARAARAARSADPACLCGSGKAAADCCAPCLEGEKLAPSAEALMRSRYVAYALGHEAYLLATWHASTRPASLELEAEPRPRWIGLTIQRAQVQGGDRAVVEFVARYRIGGRAHRLHEISRFVREDGRWSYVDGDIVE